MTTAVAIEWKDDVLYLLDQRMLPSQEGYVECSAVGDVVDAIKDMVVRGAPAIGIAAAFGVALSAKEHAHIQCKDDWRGLIDRDLNMLLESRPTAVNLKWAIEKARELIDQLSPVNAYEQLVELSQQIHEDDIAANKKMADLACEYISGTSDEKKFSMITHCNTGSLATGGYGTALGVVRKAWELGLIDRVYADETRPWLQGSRLTAWELKQDGIPVTLNADSAAAYLMSKSNIKWAIVGADRITANGDVANKIGTYALAIMAKYHNVKFMVVAPSSTVDMSIESGGDIEIEMRSEQELVSIKSHSLAPEGVDVRNPVFDVTPAELIDVIVTERGLITNPSLEAMRVVFN